MSFQFFHLFRLLEAIAAHNAWNYNKNFHRDWGKNSLDVIGHTHTSGLCLSPIRHSGGVCGPSCGASQSVCTVLLFSTTSKRAPAWQIISLTGLQHSHRPVSPIYLLCEEELTLEETRKWGFSLWSYCNCATWAAARGAEEGGGGGLGDGSSPNFSSPLFFFMCRIKPDMGKKIYRRNNSRMHRKNVSPNQFVVCKSFKRGIN